MQRILLVLMSAMLAVMLAACGADKSTETKGNADAVSNATSETSQEQTEQAKSTVYPLTVKDASGKEITFEKAPEKIVSTSPAETEMLFALGLNDRIVGVSDYDDYPEEAKSKTKVGGVVEPNAEAIVAAGSDLVVSGISISEEALEHLNSLGLKVFASNPKSVDDVLSEILLLGQITDKQPEAEALVGQMNADIQKVKDAAATVKDKKKMYIEFSPGWTVGSGEFMDELITLAGGINIASDVAGWYQINEERIVADNPDVIMYTLDGMDNDSGKTIDQLIYSRTGWDQIKAVKDKQVIGVDGNLLSRPGPRITQGLLAISNALYPGAVK
ncbi:ABC transporter substrate-binding protein [Paenibacillus sp. CCS19]|uniref:ABC transporter substrate-binding protein n=1 Tax=Paenibacillus sp. CCS19 TaxID=3158387 RepID=UPI0025645644|nr:ABC transporter substrate-binding protein [Paenibacillus cellulosilyticus]GMK39308.1 ABC transporter substrate-binding protein [Paenibacillus cellulosilyticus]